MIDFSKYSAGTPLHLVNLQEQTGGKLPGTILTVAQATSGKSPDPCVGSCLEFRVVGPPPQKDVSVIPPTMVPNPAQPTVTNNRTFTFGGQGYLTENDPVTTYDGPGTWAITTFNNDQLFSETGHTICNIDSDTIGNGNDDANCRLLADFGRISAAPASGSAETWTLVHGGTWDHPIHIHFEEAQILARNNHTDQVPAWEQGRKDVFRLRPSGTLTLFIQFRDWGGMFMEHCHNTMHEDNAMLLRWEINDAGGVFLNPLPTPIPHPTGVTFEPPDEILAGALQPYDSQTNGKPGGALKP